MNSMVEPFGFINDIFLKKMSLILVGNSQNLDNNSRIIFTTGMINSSESSLSSKGSHKGAHKKSPPKYKVNSKGNKISIKSKGVYKIELTGNCSVDTKIQIKINNKNESQDDFSKINIMTGNFTTFTTLNIKKNEKIYFISNNIINNLKVLISKM